MTIIESLNEFNRVLAPKMVAYVNSVTASVTLFTSAIIIIYIGVKVILNFVNGGGKLDPYILVRPCLMLVAINLYTPLVELCLYAPTDLVSGIIKEGVLKITGLSEANFEKEFSTSITHVQNVGADGNGVYDMIQINPFIEVVHIIIYFIASVCAGYILFKGLLLKYLYFILGIFVMPFSLIPGNQKIISSWFFGFLSVLLWVPVINLLKCIIILLPIETTEFTNVLLSVALQVMMIGMILKTPSIANMLVSEGSNLGTPSAGGGMLSGLMMQAGYIAISKISSSTAKNKQKSQEASAQSDGDRGRDY